MSHQKVTSKFPTAERPALSSRQQDPHHPNKQAAGFLDVRGRRYTGTGVPKAYRIKTIAEALDVSPRTVRRWIATRKLIAHQIDGVVRITDADFRAFLALYRCA